MSYVPESLPNLFRDRSKESDILDLIDEAIIEIDHDRTFTFINAKAESFWKQSSGDLLGKNIWKEYQDLNDSLLYTVIEKTFKEKVKVAEEFFFPVTGRQVSVKTTPSHSGILVILSDIQGEWENRQNLKKKQQKLKDAQSIGHIGSFERDLKSGIITWSDELYRIHGLVPQSEEIKWEKFLSFVHKHDLPAVLEAIQHTHRAGDRLNLIHRIIRADGELRYVHRRAEIIKDERGIPVKIYGTVQDITDLKQAELALKESKELLQSVLDSSKALIQVLKAIRDEKGDIIDFHWVMINKVAQESIGSMVGENLLKHNPGVVESGFFEKCKQVADTGETLQFELSYNYESFSNWFDLTLVKLKDGLVVTGLDITERKKAELAANESKELIENISSTVPDLIAITDIKNDRLTYANHDKFWVEYNIPADIRNMNSYECVNMVVDPDFLEKTRIFLKERMTLTGKEIKEVELKIKTGSWVRIRSMIFKRDEKENPLEILSIITNITGRKKAEEELIKLKLSQQKEILNAIMNTQEEERKRISEALHNGLGQLLYAIKIKVESIKTDPAMKDQIRISLEVDKLLNEAIDQARSISFQLTPQLLETFGLKEAIKSVVENFKSDKLHIHYQFLSERQRFDPNLEISVFRIVQELMNNIVKHSGASIATLRIESKQDTLMITAKDNGNGFKKDCPENKKCGLGMQMIANRVKLMNGSMAIDSDEASGTKISIFINL